MVGGMHPPTPQGHDPQGHQPGNIHSANICVQRPCVYNVHNMLFIIICLKIYSMHIYNTFKSISGTYTGSIFLSHKIFNCQTRVQGMKNEQNHMFSFITSLKCLFCYYSQLPHVLKHFKQCTSYLST